MKTFDSVFANSNTRDKGCSRPAVRDISISRKLWKETVGKTVQFNPLPVSRQNQRREDWTVWAVEYTHYHPLLVTLFSDRGKKCSVMVYK